MPTRDFEREVLRAIAANRNPDNFLGGPTQRSHQQQHTFHDTRESLAQASEWDLMTLKGAGYEVHIQKSQENLRRVAVKRGGLETRIEWVFDSAFRFFPVEPDLDSGWRLNFWDLATNKVLALFVRPHVRDYLDCLYLHQHHLPLGALAWAATAKEPSLEPPMIIEGLRRGKYRPEQLVDLHLSHPVDLQALRHTWLEACAEAEALFSRLPHSEPACLYLDGYGKPVCPIPDSPDFTKLTRHTGSIKGAWPRVVQA